MKLTTFSPAPALAVLVLLTSAATVAGAAEGLPPHHPIPRNLLSEFGGSFRCPYASEWLQKGPEKAARDLGLTLGDQQGGEGRSLQEGGVGGGGGQGGPPSGMWGQQPEEGASTTCMIAPGPMGAGHMAAYSTGYASACPGTPAEGSPYQWPLAWSALIESESMMFGSDDVKFHSRGRVWYRLDKNWKRADTYYTRGVQRSIGQSPCDPENVVSAPGEAFLACRRNSDSRRTMIHRGSQMYFITWKNGTVGDDVANIDTCRWLDLQIVGNIRPDWYMDKRGESTDVQYLGKQHVYHSNKPRLVQQWRKQDFADQYFTMSIQGNVVEDGIHWPLILNVPGEGFGDDFLQKYTNHSLLTDDDDFLFLLDQALVESGGSCPQMERNGTVGPPTSEVEPIPSNLEVDPNAWFTNEVTFSPVWNPPVSADDYAESDSGAEPARAVTTAGSVAVTSCYDSNAGAVDLSLTFTDVNAESSEGGELPWVALGYRESEECLMTPRGGGNTELILVASSQNGDEDVTASLGSLSPAAKRFEQDAFAAIYDGMIPLSEADGFAKVELLLPSDDSETPDIKSSEGGKGLQLRFQQTMEQPETMNLMYAIGSSSQLGYHSKRECFQVTEFPACPSEDSVEPGANEVGADEEVASGTLPVFSRSSFAAICAIVAALVM